MGLVTAIDLNMISSWAAEDETLSKDIDKLITASRKKWFTPSQREIREKEISLLGRCRAKYIKHFGGRESYRESTLEKVLYTANLFLEFVHENAGEKEMILSGFGNSDMFEKMRYCNYFFKYPVHIHNKYEAATSKEFNVVPHNKMARLHQKVINRIFENYLNITITTLQVGECLPYQTRLRFQLKAPSIDINSTSLSTHNKLG